MSTEPTICKYCDKQIAADQIVTDSTGSFHMNCRLVEHVYQKLCTARDLSDNTSDPSEMICKLCDKAITSKDSLVFAHGKSCHMNCYMLVHDKNYLNDDYSFMEPKYKPLSAAGVLRRIVATPIILPVAVLSFVGCSIYGGCKGVYKILEWGYGRDTVRRPYTPPTENQTLSRTLITSVQRGLHKQPNKIYKSKFIAFNDDAPPEDDVHVGNWHMVIHNDESFEVIYRVAPTAPRCAEIASQAVDPQTIASSAAAVTTIATNT